MNNTKTFALTGRLCAGKTWVGEQCGRREASLAEPLYALGELLIGASDKKMPGVREFLQQIGQWGRGTLSEKYPLTIERARVSRMLRDPYNWSEWPEMRERAFRNKRAYDYLFNDNLHASGEYYCPASGVRWEGFGRNPDIWISALCVRLEIDDTPQFVSNCRFENERAYFVKNQHPVYHVTCRQETFEARWKTQALTANALHDVSEQLALSIEADLQTEMTTQEICAKHGLAGIIWNDDKPFWRPQCFWDDMIESNVKTIESFKKVWEV